MKKKLLVIYSIILLFTSQICISDIFVTYISGECKVDINGNGTWEEAVIDMKLKDTSVIKTDSAGLIEIQIDDDLFSFGQNSVVRLKDVLLRMGEKKKLGWLKTVSKFTKIVGRGDETYVKTATAGVRGEDTGVGELEWFEEIDEEGVEQLKFQDAKSLFHDGQYAKAIPLFTELITDVEIGSFRNEISYYLGTSLFHNLQYQKALNYLAESITDKNTYYYETALIHYAITHYLLKNYAEAIISFNLYSEDFSRGKLLPFAIFMLGKCYKDLGNREKARAYFLEVSRNYKESELYKDALNEINSL